MNKYSLAHLSQEAVLAGAKAHLGNERGSLALVLAHIGEIEAQEYYKPAGYSSVHMYCVHELHLSKDAAYKRIHAARAARDFPAIFERVAEGALCLSIVNLLAPHLTPENAEELLAEAVFRTRFEVEQVLAARNPRPACPTTIKPIVEPLTLAAEDHDESLAELAPGRVQEVARSPRVEPISAQLYELRLTIDEETLNALRTAKDLLGHRHPAPDEAEIVKMASSLLVAQLRKRKHGATDQPRAARRSKSPHYVTNDVMRQVWERDGGQCTFVGDTGKRCPETSRLEYDHKQPVAKGGDSGTENIRLRCRAHNQLEAERAFGRDFMQHKRERAKAAAVKRKAEKERNHTTAATPQPTVKQEVVKAGWEICNDDEEVIAWLKNFHYSAEDGRWAVKKVGPRRGVMPASHQLECLYALRERDRSQPPAVA